MRSKLVTVHLWLGLTLGLIWALQGLTGSALVFFRELDRLTIPTPTSGAMVSLDLIVANAQRAAAGAPVLRLAVADDRRDIVHAYYDSSTTLSPVVTIDAATATPLALRDLRPKSPVDGPVTYWLDNLHLSLLGGRSGEVLVAVSGLVLVTGIITGLWVGWPRRGGWKAAFAFRRWRTLRLEHRLFGWHRAAGLAAGLLIILLSLSGAYQNIGAAVDSLVAQFAPFEHHYHPEPGTSPPLVNISAQQAHDIARSRFPTAQWVRLFLPTAERPAYVVRMHQPEEIRAWLGKTLVYIDPASGSILGTYDPLKLPLSNRILDATFSLHNGELGGLPGRILVLILGPVLPALYVTGLVAWMRKRKRKARAVQTAARHPASAPLSQSAEGWHGNS